MNVFEKKEEIIEIPIIDTYEEKTFSDKLEEYSADNMNLYLIIEFSRVRHINKIEANQYFKEGIYFTKGKDENGEIYIFDLEKNSILPEVRFLDGYSGSGSRQGFNFFGPGFIFILVLVLIFVYYQFFAEKKPESSLSPTTNIVNTIPGTENLVSANNLTNTGTITQIIEPNISTNNNNDLNKLNDSIQNASSSIKLLDTELQLKELEYKSLETQLKVVTSDLNVCLEKNNNLKIDLDSSNQIIEDQKKYIISDNQLFLYIGKQIFEECEKKSSDVCKNMIYNFYNLKK